MNASSFENTFKQASALVELKKPDLALEKFKSVCESIEAVVRSNPNANVELHLVPLSLTKISDIYKERDDLDKALAFMQVARKFLEYISANRPNKEDEPSDDGDREEYTIGALFIQMHKAFEKPDAPPKQDPAEIVKMFQEAKKKREEEIAKENMQKLKDALAARKEKLRTSRWARFVEYVNNHPIGIAVGSVVFLAVFLVFALLIFRNSESDPSRKLSRARTESTANSKNAQNRGVRRKGQAKERLKEMEKQKKMGHAHDHSHAHAHTHDSFDAEKEQEKLRKLMEQFDFKPGEEPTPENFQAHLEDMRADTARKLEEIRRKSSEGSAEAEHKDAQPEQPEHAEKPSINEEL